MFRAISAVVLGLAVGLLVGSPLAHASAQSGTVSVSAVVPSTVRLVITAPGDGQSVDFGAVAPGEVTPPQSVGVLVRSNRPYSVSKTALDADALGLVTSLADSSANPKTNEALFTDTYMLDVPETTAPGSYIATVQYTVVQE
jgi:type 1 fimbria pilin